MRLRGCPVFLALALTSTTLMAQTAPDDTTRRTEPARPAGARPAEPTRPTEPVRPTEPPRPTEPVRPTEPLRPTDPARTPEPLRPSEPARVVDEIGRRPSEQAPGAAVTSPPARPCAGSPPSATAAPSHSAFPGVSASQLPRAGVSAEAFVRPGVSTAQLATLQPGSPPTPCAPPRDVILYPDTGAPARRVPPPGDEQP
jgi:outer membrane biosynthesis protein TonB